MTKLFSIKILLIVFLATSSFAQESYEWLPGGTYDPKIPTPKQFLGFEIGDYLTDNLQMVAYIRELQRVSTG